MAIAELKAESIARALSIALLVPFIYLLIGPPLGALTVVGPLFAVVGYAVGGPTALFVGAHHAMVLLTVSSLLLRCLVVLCASLSLTTLLFVRSAPPTRPEAWVHRWLTDDYWRVALVALIPASVCFVSIELFRAHRKRKRDAQRYEADLKESIRAFREMHSSKGTAETLTTH